MGRRPSEYLGYAMIGMAAVLAGWNVHLGWRDPLSDIGSGEDMAGGAPEQLASAAIGRERMPARPDVGNETRLTHAQQYASLIESSVFNPGRRPVPVQVAEEPEPEAEPEPRRVEQPPERLDLVIEGIIASGDEPVAWVRKPRERQVREIRPGTTLDGWEVREIAPTAVILRSTRGGLQDRFELFEGLEPAGGNTPKAGREGSEARPGNDDDLIERMRRMLRDDS